MSGIPDNLIKSIPEEARIEILRRVLERGVKPRDLGVTSQYIYMILHGRRRVSDNLLKKLLKYIPSEEVSKIIVSYTFNGFRQEIERFLKDYTVLAQVARVIRDLAMKDNVVRNIFFDIMKTVAKDDKVIHVYKVREEDVERFERILRAKGRSEKTIKDRIRYLRKALSDLNWELSPETIEEYLYEVANESPHIAGHIAVSLKLFIKYVIKDDLLYNSFKIVRNSLPVRHEPLTLDQVRAIAKHIAHLGAKAYFVLLTETGLRPGEVLNLRLSDIDLKERVIRVFKEGKTKRAYISFFSEKTKEFLIKEYLPFRQDFIERYEVALRNLGFSEEYVKEWKQKLFPFKDYELRQEIYRASEKVLGRQIRLYDLRSFFASYMSLKGVPGQIIDLLQGRVPPREFEVLQRHYLAISIGQLREIYDRAGLVVLG